SADTSCGPARRPTGPGAAGERRAGAPPVPGRRRLASELHRLDLEELLEAVLAVLPPVAAVLVAAEARVRVERAAVDLDLAGADPAGAGLCPLGVGAPHAAGEPVDGVGGDAGGVVLVVVADDRQQRPDDLFVGDGHVVADLGEDRRLHVVAALQRLALGQLGAADDGLGALLD